jgi:L-cysteine S-thiosulfotransferase
MSEKHLSQQTLNKPPQRQGRARVWVAATGVAAVVGCASLPSTEALDQQAAAAVRASFRDEGIAKVDRLRQESAVAVCSTGQAPSDAVAERVMNEARASVKWPTGGRYMGDWREGEKLAQNGRGLTFTDTSTAAKDNGGSCYNCHQISAAEISHGTIGPSLLHYGKNRGVAEVTAPTSQAIIEYTWMKLYNAKSYNACSNMPRFGHLGLLDESQLRDLMALLLDPKSPVNQQP